MKVAVMGTGHVGLVTCVAFASIGHDVTGTDVDAEKIEALRRGVSPFYEPGLDDALVREMASGRLSFTLEASEALRGAEAVFIVSNRATTLGLVADLERRGIPAFGPIWDS